MKRFFSAIVLVAALLPVSAQDSTQVAEPVGARLNPFGKAEWIFGIHGVVADDDGRTIKGIFDVANGWNFNPYPSRISAERTFTKDWRVEVAASYIKYSAGKLLNEVVSTSSQSSLIIDINAKYKALNFFKIHHAIVDPYTVSGLGFTYRSGLINGKATPTINLGLGCNFWLYKNFGLNVQTCAKIKVLPSSSNYLMHSLGIVYRLNHVENGDPRHGSILEIR